MFEETIVKATLKDVSQIKEIETENLLEKKNEEERRREGFITNPISLEDFQKFAEDPSVFLFVRKKADVVLGYILSYDSNYWLREHIEEKKAIKIEEESKEIYKKILGSRFLYVEELAVKREHIGHGIGIGLTKHLIKFSRSQAYKYLLGMITQEPASNVRSYLFNEQRGYKYLGFCWYKEKVYAVLYLQL